MEASRVWLDMHGWGISLFERQRGLKWIIPWNQPLMVSLWSSNKWGITARIAPFVACRALDPRFVPDRVLITRHLLRPMVSVEIAEGNSSIDGLGTMARYVGCGRFLRCGARQRNYGSGQRAGARSPRVTQRPGPLRKRTLRRCL